MRRRARADRGTGIQRIGDRRAGLEHQRPRGTGRARRDAAEMVGVGVRDDHCRDRTARRAAAGRRHDSAARVAPLAGRPGVDHDQCPPGVRSTAASPCPTSRKCNARLGRSSPEPGQSRAQGRPRATSVSAQPARRPASDACCGSPWPRARRPARRPTASRRPGRGRAPRDRRERRPPPPPGAPEDGERGRRRAASARREAVRQTG